MDNVLLESARSLGQANSVPWKLHTVKVMQCCTPDNVMARVPMLDAF